MHIAHRYCRKSLRQGQRCYVDKNGLERSRPFESRRVQKAANITVNCCSSPYWGSNRPLICVVVSNTMRPLEPTLYVVSEEVAPSNGLIVPRPLSEVSVEGV